MQAYCLKCKCQRTISNPEAIVMKNGRPATHGRCEVCNTKMYRMGKADGVPA
jgi:Domain of unknown function (DUF5679)